MANIITGLRIVISAVLLFCPAFSPVFYVLYLFAGFSDIIDGAVARRTNTAGEFGAKLDTAADFVFAAVCMLKLLPKMLSKVLVDTIYWSVMHQGKVAACASTAIEYGYALIQNVIVDANARGLGLGEKLCRALIAKAKEHGAEHAYLQVVKTNEVAINLYKKLGFKKAYTYWYMKKASI